MKKKVLSVVIALALVVVTAFASVAATRGGAIELADLKRFQDTVAKSRASKGANITSSKIINYQQIGAGEWMVRLSVKNNQDVTYADGTNGKASDQCAGDFRVRFSQNPPAVGTNLGKCWYWFGLFDATHNICGYAIAVREYQHMAGKYYTYPTPDRYDIPEFQ